MHPDEALCHEWILEGLPPKVLAHHARMFGLQLPPGIEDKAEDDDEEDKPHNKPDK
jgi:hypothetical protein